MHVHVDSQSFMQSFFRACLRKNGVMVPGSERIGHNVLVNNGRDWLAKLSSWATFGSPDVANTNRRIRWIGVGDSQHLESEAVVTLANAVSITTGPDVYLAQIDAPPTFLSLVWAKFTRTLSTTEVSHSGAVAITEAGLYADVLPNPVLNGDFANWTTDDPDNWTTTETGGAVVTERGYNQGGAGGGTGSCNFNKGAPSGSAIINQVINVVVGKSYTLAFNIGFVGSGSLLVTDSGAGAHFYQSFTTVGPKSISFTATTPTITLGFAIFAIDAKDITIDNVGLFDAGGAASPDSGLNPVVAYKAFDGLVKSPGFTLDLEWSFRF